MTTEFWPQAWDLERQLNDVNPTSTEGSVVAERLMQLSFQDFIFRFRRWADPRWFETFDQVGLFASPPEPESFEGGFLVRRWPVIQYLKAVSEGRTSLVVDRLRKIQTQNWWVISDALELTASLPPRACADLVQHFLPQWEQVSSQWVPRNVWKKILTKLARVTDSETRISEILSRLGVRVLTRPTGARISALDIVEATSSPTVRKFVSAVADGMENAVLLTLPRGDRPPGYLLKFDVAEEDKHSRYPIPVLLAEWWRCVQIESSKYGAGRTALRAGRLSRSSDSFAVGMGLRALRAALDNNPSDPIATDAFYDVLTRDQIVDDYFLEAELFPLLRSHWETLPVERRADLETSWLETASASTTNSRQARDRLGAVRQYLGAGEQVSLREIEFELGEAVTERELPDIGAVWVGPESPVDERQLSSMSVADIMALMRHTPGPRRGDWRGPSPEGLARALAPLIAGRLSEWLDVLDAVASEVPYISIQTSVIGGLEEGFKQRPELKTDSNLEKVSRFFNGLLNRIDDGAFASTGDDFTTPSHVIGAMADWVEGLADWVASSPSGQTILPVIQRSLTDSDPTRESEQTFGGDNMNPPTLALNVTRGKGLRATFSLLAHHWGEDDAPSTELRTQLEGLIQHRIVEEQSPAVKSVIGLYLPHIITYWRELWDNSADEILPRDEELIEHWSAVFTTYLLFHPARDHIASEVEEHYRLGVIRIGENHARFLSDHIDNLMTHIIALSIYSDEPDKWENLLAQALDTAPDEKISAAIGNLESGIRSESADVTFEYLQRLATTILSRSRRDGNLDSSLVALMNVVTATPFSLDVVGGLLLDVLSSGPAPDIDDLSAYLTRVDDEGSWIGAQIFAAAMSAGEVSGMFYSIDSIRQALRSYAATFPGEMRPLVDALGWQGVFELENEARQIYENL